MLNKNSATNLNHKTIINYFSYDVDIMLQSMTICSTAFRRIHSTSWRTISRRQWEACAFALHWERSFVVLRLLTCEWKAPERSPDHCVALWSPPDSVRTSTPSNSISKSSLKYVQHAWSAVTGL